MIQLINMESMAVVAIVWRNTWLQDSLSPEPRAMPAIATPPMETISPTPKYRFTIGTPKLTAAIPSSPT